MKVYETGFPSVTGNLSFFHIHLPTYKNGWWCLRFTAVKRIKLDTSLVKDCPTEKEWYERISRKFDVHKHIVTNQVYTNYKTISFQKIK